MSTPYTCHQTVIRNVSNGLIGFLPLFRIANLAAGATFSIDGDVYAWLAANYPGIAGRHAIAAFNKMIDDGVLTRVSVPADECGDVYDASSSLYAPDLLEVSSSLIPN